MTTISQHHRHKQYSIEFTLRMLTLMICVSVTFALADHSALHSMNDDISVFARTISHSATATTSAIVNASLINYGSHLVHAGDAEEVSEVGSLQYWQMNPADRLVRVKKGMF